MEDLDVEVLGIQRVMKPTSGDPVVWHSYYTVEGLFIFLHVVFTLFSHFDIVLLLFFSINLQPCNSFCRSFADIVCVDLSYKAFYWAS